MRKALTVALLGGLVLAILPAESAGVKKTSSADKGELKKTVEQLITELGDKRFKVRQKAQNRLSKMGVEALPYIVKARKSTRDLEVVWRLDRVIPAMERAAMLLPRTVTLRLENKSLRDVITEISRQTGYQIDLNANIFANKNYKFHFEKMPFWQALDKVCEASGLSIYQYSHYGSGGNDRIQLTTYGSKPSPLAQYTETFRLVPAGIHYYRNINYGTGPTKADPHSRSESMNLNFLIYTEPKLPFVQVLSPVVKEAYDENKKPMAPKVVNSPYPSYGRGSYYSNSRFLNTSTSVNLIRPSRDSKMAKLVRGEIPVVVLSKEQEEVRVDKPVGVKKKKFKGRRAEMEIEEVTKANNWGNGNFYTIKMNIREDSDNPNYDYSWRDSLQYRLCLEDAKGNKYQVWSNSLWNTGGRGGRYAQGSITYRAPDNNTGEPVKFVYYRWVTEQHRIKFEFKDLPLP
jgi:hypothetical protein